MKPENNPIINMNLCTRNKPKTYPKQTLIIAQSYPKQAPNNQLQNRRKWVATDEPSAGQPRQRCCARKWWEVGKGRGLHLATNPQVLCDWNLAALEGMWTNPIIDL